jgi:hypothetical protein
MDLDWFRRHPVVLASTIACVLIGLILGPILLPDDWTLSRQLSIGFLSGLFSAICLIAGHIFRD